MFAEEINENYDTKDKLEILLNILKETYPELDTLIDENNSLNLNNIVNSELFDKVLVNKKFKKVIKTGLKYSNKNEVNNTEEGNLFNIFNTNNITVFLPEFKKYIKKNNKHRSINNIVNILENDEKITKNKDFNTLFNDYENEKTLEDLLLDLYKLYNNQNTNDKSLEDNQINIKETIYNIYDKVIFYGFKNNMLLRIIPQLKNILYLETINKSNVLNIYDSMDNIHKSKYDILLLDKLINLTNSSIRTIKHKEYNNFNIIKRIKNKKITSNELGSYLIDNSNNLLNHQVENSNIIIIMADYVLNSIRKKSESSPTQGLTFSLLLSFMEPKTFNRFVYTVQRDFNTTNTNPLFNTIKEELEIKDIDDTEYSGRMRKRLNRSYDFPIRKRAIKTIIQIVKERHTLNQHLELLEKTATTNINTKHIIKNYVV